MSYAKHALILCIACGMLLVGEAILPASAPGRVTGFVRLYFQPAEISGVSGSYFMDTPPPSGSTNVSGAAVFFSRPLATPQIIQHFRVQLWLAPTDHSRRISARVGWSDQNYKRSPEWCAPCGSSGDTPSTVKVVTFSFDVNPMTIKPGDRLYITFTHPILWGDSGHASCVETDYSEFLGIPIPEFPSAMILSMILIVALSVTTLSARSLVRKEKPRKSNLGSVC